MTENSLPRFWSVSCVPSLPLLPSFSCTWKDLLKASAVKKLAETCSTTRTYIPIRPWNEVGSLSHSSAKSRYPLSANCPGSSSFAQWTGFLSSTYIYGNIWEFCRLANNVFSFLYFISLSVLTDRSIRGTSDSNDLLETTQTMSPQHPLSPLELVKKILLSSSFSRMMIILTAEWIMLMNRSLFSTPKLCTT